MSVSTTIIAALKFEGGVVIAADSQASDMLAGVRWRVEKLDQINGLPLVVGFAGNVGMGERARAALRDASWHANMFAKRDRVRDALDRCLNPIYIAIREKVPENLKLGSPVWDIGLAGLGAFWAEGEGHIVEYGLNGDCEFHQYFHAIGSGESTAYAIWRTLSGTSGENMQGLDERKALFVMLRILRTCIMTEMWGVDHPLGVWVVSGTTRRVHQEEVEAHLQYVDEWEGSDRRRFFDS